MIGFGQWSPIEEVESLIQSKVGDFLKAKAKLVEMSKSPLLTISDRAKELLATQQVLEGQTDDIYETIRRIKSDVYTLSDFVKVGTFGYEMIKHLNNVEELEKEYLSQGELAKPPQPTNWLLIGGLGLLGIYLWKKKK